MGILSERGNLMEKRGEKGLENEVVYKVKASRADGFTRRGGKRQMDRRDRKIYRWIGLELAECICELTCMIFAVPLSVLMCICPQQTPPTACLVH